MIIRPSSEEKKEIRKLNADEIDVREHSRKNNGATFLLYKNARSDQRILDETFGMYGWQREHSSIDGNLYCTVSIWSDTLNQWIKKQDVGVESNASKEKGQASDSFKRACTTLGIGRELYTAPLIWVQLNESELKTKNLKFKVSEIEYSNDRISKLVLVDAFGKERYRYPSSNYGRKNSKDDLIKEMLAKIYNAQSLEELRAIWQSCGDLRLKNVPDVLAKKDAKKAELELSESQKTKTGKPELIAGSFDFKRCVDAINNGTSIDVLKTQFYMSPEVEKALLDGKI